MTYTIFTATLICTHQRHPSSHDNQKCPNIDVHSPRCWGLLGDRMKLTTVLLQGQEKPVHVGHRLAVP